MEEDLLYQKYKDSCISEINVGCNETKRKSIYCQESENGFIKEGTTAFVKIFNDGQKETIALQSCENNSRLLSNIISQNHKISTIRSWYDSSFDKDCILNFSRKTSSSSWNLKNEKNVTTENRSVFSKHKCDRDSYDTKENTYYREMLNKTTCGLSDSHLSIRQSCLKRKLDSNDRNESNYRVEYKKNYISRSSLMENSDNIFSRSKHFKSDSSVLTSDKFKEHISLKFNLVSSFNTVENYYNCRKMKNIEIQSSPIRIRVATSFGEDSVEYVDPTMEVELDSAESDPEDPDEPNEHNTAESVQDQQSEEINDGNSTNAEHIIEENVSNIEEDTSVKEEEDNGDLRRVTENETNLSVRESISASDAPQKASSSVNLDSTNKEIEGNDEADVTKDAKDLLDAAKSPSDSMDFVDIKEDISNTVPTETELSQSQEKETDDKVLKRNGEIENLEESLYEICKSTTEFQSLDSANGKNEEDKEMQDDTITAQGETCDEKSEDLESLKENKKDNEELEPDSDTLACIEKVNNENFLTENGTSNDAKSNKLSDDDIIKHEEVSKDAEDFMDVDKDNVADHVNEIKSNNNSESEAKIALDDVEISKSDINEFATENGAFFGSEQVTEHSEEQKEESEVAKSELSHRDEDTKPDEISEDLKGTKSTEEEHSTNQKITSADNEDIKQVDEIPKQLTEKSVDEENIKIIDDEGVDEQNELPKTAECVKQSDEEIVEEPKVESKDEENAKPTEEDNEKKDIVDEEEDMESNEVAETKDLKEDSNEEKSAQQQNDTDTSERNEASDGVENIELTEPKGDDECKEINKSEGDEDIEKKEIYADEKIIKSEEDEYTEGKEINDDAKIIKSNEEEYTEQMKEPDADECSLLNENGEDEIKEKSKADDTILLIKEMTEEEKEANDATEQPSVTETEDQIGIIKETECTISSEGTDVVKQNEEIDYIEISDLTEDVENIEKKGDICDIENDENGQITDGTEKHIFEEDATNIEEIGDQDLIESNVDDDDEKSCEDEKVPEDNDIVLSELEPTQAFSKKEADSNDKAEDAKQLCDDGDDVSDGVCECTVGELSKIELEESQKGPEEDKIDTESHEIAETNETIIETAVLEENSGEFPKEDESVEEQNYESGNSGKNDANEQKDKKPSRQSSAENEETQDVSIQNLTSDVSQTAEADRIMESENTDAQSICEPTCDKSNDTEALVTFEEDTIKSDPTLDMKDMKAEEKETTELKNSGDILEVSDGEVTEDLKVPTSSSAVDELEATQDESKNETDDEKNIQKSDEENEIQESPANDTTQDLPGKESVQNELIEPASEGEVIKSVASTYKRPPGQFEENILLKSNEKEIACPFEKSKSDKTDSQSTTETKVISPRKGIKVEEDEIETAISSVMFYDEMSDGNDQSAKLSSIIENSKTFQDNEIISVETAEFSQLTAEETVGENVSPKFKDEPLPLPASGEGEKTGSEGVKTPLSVSPKKRKKKRKATRSRSTQKGGLVPRNRCCNQTFLLLHTLLLVSAFVD